MGRKRMLVELVERGVGVSEAAVVAGMSRQNAHKWLGRVQKRGVEEGLKELSRARKTQRRFEGASVAKLLALRRKHPGWGPRQLLGQVALKHPRLVLPAASTLTELMRAAGLLKRRRRLKSNRPIFHQRPATAPNEVWTIDFKGQFRLRNGRMCYPLTLRDAFTRKVLRVVALPNTQHEAVIAIVASAFREFGLPQRIHSDTGAPFGSTGFGRLSQLSLFVMRLGIQHTFSRRGKPQDNGGHERMHLDLKRDTAMPPARSMPQQQLRFDAFVECFNRIRLHQALGMRTPDSVWTRSRRRMPKRVPSESYDASWDVRRVDISGRIMWNAEKIFVGSALRGADVGLEAVDDGLWRIHFAGFPIGLIVEKRNGTLVLDYLDDDPQKVEHLTSSDPSGKPSTAVSTNGAFARSARFGIRLAA
jgi:putative transposase